MTIRKITNVCKNNPLCTLGKHYTSHHNYTDIVIIQDNKSLIDGKPYVFQFAVENRPPALDRIFEPLQNIDPNRYDIVVVENNTITIRPFGYDPDEDNV